jgi:hypothetical protein
MTFRIDRNVGDLGRSNSRIADVAFWSANVADEGGLPILIADNGPYEL